MRRWIYSSYKTEITFFPSYSNIKNGTTSFMDDKSDVCVPYTHPQEALRGIISHEKSGGVVFKICLCWMLTKICQDFSSYNRCRTLRSELAHQRSRASRAAASNVSYHVRKLMSVHTSGRLQRLWFICWTVPKLALKLMHVLCRRQIKMLEEHRVPTGRGTGQTANTMKN